MSAPIARAHVSNPPHRWSRGHISVAHICTLGSTRRVENLGRQTGV